jgi:uncharacterized linocin/CFP29 family protein
VNHLLRDKAPITETGWKLIDEEAHERLEPGLAARRVVDFNGPHGWEYSATSLGRVDEADGNGIETATRRVLPVTELRVPFALDRRELAQGDRGAEDVDFDALAAAAARIVEAENAAIFHGSKDLGVEGVTETCTRESIRHEGDADALPTVVAGGVEQLMRGGVAGPFALVLGPEAWTYVEGAAEQGGWPLRRHLGEILDGPVVWAPGVSGGILMSMRGGDFIFDCGQDLAIGYRSHDAEIVQLYFELSFTFRVVTPEAALPISVG